MKIDQKPLEEALERVGQLEELEHRTAARVWLAAERATAPARRGEAQDGIRASGRRQLRNGAWAMSKPDPFVVMASPAAREALGAVIAFAESIHRAAGGKTLNASLTRVRAWARKSLRKNNRKRSHP